MCVCGAWLVCSAQVLLFYQLSANRTGLCCLLGLRRERVRRGRVATRLWAGWDPRWWHTTTHDKQKNLHTHIDIYVQCGQIYISRQQAFLSFPLLPLFYFLESCFACLLCLLARDVKTPPPDSENRGPGVLLEDSPVHHDQQQQQRRRPTGHDDAFPLVGSARSLSPPPGPSRHNMQWVS